MNLWGRLSFVEERENQLKTARLKLEEFFLYRLSEFYGLAFSRLGNRRDKI
jgi:hypothetical protein